MIQIEIDDVTVNRRLSPSPYAPELMFNESDASFRLHSFMRNVTRILLLFRSFSFVWLKVGNLTILIFPSHCRRRLRHTHAFYSFIFFDIKTNKQKKMSFETSLIHLRRWKGSARTHNNSIIIYSSIMFIQALIGLSSRIWPVGGQLRRDFQINIIKVDEWEQELIMKQSIIGRGAHGKS